MSFERQNPALRALSDEELRTIRAAREKAFVLYEGRETPHRSCGIALAETFNLPTPAYQSLRRGGITGRGECGAIKAGELVLGELLGDTDPTGAVTDELREAALLYRDLWEAKIERPAEAGDSIVCNDLTAPHGDFMGPARCLFCTNLAADVASIVQEVLVRLGRPAEITDILPDGSPRTND
ncbi:MAG: hypothetical protein AAF488_15440 [Planctomycetota bacterium]